MTDQARKTDTSRRRASFAKDVASQQRQQNNKIDEEARRERRAANAQKLLASLLLGGNAGGPAPSNSTATLNSSLTAAHHGNASSSKNAVVASPSQFKLDLNQQHPDTQQKQQEQEHERRQRYPQDSSGGSIHHNKDSAATPSMTTTGETVEDDTDVQITSAAQRWLQSIPMERHIPVDDASELHQSYIYQSLRTLVEWQRDNYMVGEEYANWRGTERAKQQQQQQQIAEQTKVSQHQQLLPTYQPQPQIDVANLPLDTKALGHGQLADIAAQFIPSAIVHQTVLPIVIEQATGQWLYQTTRNAVLDLLHDQQTTLNAVAKQQVIDFLQNPKNRRAMKNSTRGYISSHSNHYSDK